MTTIEIRTRDMYSDLSKAEKRVADYILQHRDNIFIYPLAELAEQAGTSQGTWVRFCKTIGFDGMKQLKTALYNEINSTVPSKASPLVLFNDIKAFPSTTSVVDTVCHGNAQAIDDTRKLINTAQLDDIINRLIKARTISLFGIGASGCVAYDLYCKLLRIGYQVFYNQDTHVSLTSASVLTEQDVAIFFSNSGETKEILEMCEIARKNHAYCIAITKYNKSTLVRQVDQTLFTSSPEVDIRSGATSSRIAQLTLVDILFTALANRDYERIEKPLMATHEMCCHHRQ